MSLFCKSREQLIRERIVELEKTLFSEQSSCLLHEDVKLIEICASRSIATHRAIDRMWKLIFKYKK